MIDYVQLVRWRTALLTDTEQLLGPRSRRFALGDIVCAPHGTNPMIFRRGDTNIVDIRITYEALAGNSNGRLAYWQLAHECVHLIDPQFPPPTTVMEEGIATWNQNKKLGSRDFLCPSRDVAYIEAERLVAAYMDNDYLPEIIRGLRQRPVYPVRIYDITLDLLARSAPKIPSLAASKLTQPFGS